ncbi:MAG: hypothetical protein NTW08_07115 [Gammaproteobacteria bacterium]|nr:hypothetical protein [Gammaproteobacteria bacterium]
MVTPSNPVNKMSDIERAERMAADIDGTNPLSESERRAFLLDIIENSKHNEKNISERAENADLMLKNMSTIGQLEAVAHGANGLDSGLSALGFVGTILANGIGLFLVPWRCYQEHRPPTRDEIIKLGICTAALACMAVAIAAPPVAIGFAIAGAVISLARTVQILRIMKDELHRVEQLSQHGYSEIQRLTGEIKDLENLENPTSEDIKHHYEKMAELKEVTNQYVIDGCEIHQLKEELHDERQKISKLTQVAMSAVAVVGVALSFFFPPIGLGILLGAGIVSLLAVGVTAFLKKMDDRHTPPLVAPVHQANPSPIVTPVTPTPKDDVSFKAQLETLHELSEKTEANKTLSSEGPSSVPSPIDDSKKDLELHSPPSEKVIMAAELKALHPPPSEKGLIKEDKELREEVQAIRYSTLVEETNTKKRKREEDEDEKDDTHFTEE